VAGPSRPTIKQLPRPIRPAPSTEPSVSAGADSVHPLAGAPARHLGPGVACVGRHLLRIGAALAGPRILGWLSSAPVAHRTERAAPDRKAGGSIPSGRTIRLNSKRRLRRPPEPRQTAAGSQRAHNGPVDPEVSPRSEPPRSDDAST
jgi:hypothetical protein